MSSGKWVEDGSGVCGFEGNEAKCAVDTKQSSHFNCLWDDGKGVGKGGEGHYEFEITEKGKQSMFFGFVEKDNFKKGWAMKSAFMFGGNLSTGSALARSQWGPAPKTGDKVGVYAKFDGNGVNICYSLNGSSLGCGFQVSSSSKSFPSSPLFPVVSFGGDGQVVKASGKEGVLGMERAGAGGDSGVCGEWKLAAPVENHAGTAGVPFPAMNTPTLKLELEGESLVVNVKVANSMGGKAEKVEGGEKKGEGKWKGGPMRMTKMMPPPDLQPYENFFSTLFGEEFVVKGDGEGLVVSVAGEGGVSRWERGTPQGPVVL